MLKAIIKELEKRNGIRKQETTWKKILIAILTEEEANEVLRYYAASPGPIDVVEKPWTESQLF